MKTQLLLSFYDLRVGNDISFANGLVSKYLRVKKGHDTDELTGESGHCVFVARSHHRGICWLRVAEELTMDEV